MTKMLEDLAELDEGACVPVNRPNLYAAGWNDCRAVVLALIDADGDGGAVIGWVFQHDETGRMAFCENDGVNNPENFAKNNPRYALCGPAYTHHATITDMAKRLEAADALLRSMRDGAFNIGGWADAIDEYFAAMQESGEWTEGVDYD